MMIKSRFFSQNAQILFKMYGLDLRWARTLTDPIFDTPHIDPSLTWAVQQCRAIPNIHQVRLDIMYEIRDLVDSNHDLTQQWFDTIPLHCQHAYRQPEMITQIPTLIHILTQMNYPHTQQLQRELSNGFPLLGNLQPGLNRYVRTDNKYTQPTSIDELRTYNQQYIHKKLQQNHVDTHWELMADEIAKEVQQGRMAGPFEPPPWLQKHTVPLHRHTHTNKLLPIPHHNPIIAMAFSIEQTGSDGKAKIRRGEDWRRSGHNNACHMTDQPFHHTPDHYTWLARVTATHDHPLLHVWGHDHDGAYRQLPYKIPPLHTSSF